MFLGKDVLQEKNYIFTIKTSSTYIYPKIRKQSQWQSQLQ